MRTQPTQKRVVQQHYSLIRKMGFPDAVQCWCGEVLADHTNPKRRDELNAFVQVHATCKRPETEERA